MFGLSDFFRNLRENKALVCVILFVVYSLGLFSFYYHEKLLVSGIFSFFIFSTLIFLIIKPRFQNFVPYGFVFFLYLLFIFGFFNAKMHYVVEDDFSGIDYLKDVQLIGVVKAIPKYNSHTKTYKFPLNVEGANIDYIRYTVQKTTVLVSVRCTSDKAVDIKYGDKISVKGTLSTPNTATNPSQFDYRKFLNNKGILKTFYTTNDEFKFYKSPKFSDILEAKGFLPKVSAFNVCFTRLMNDIRDSVIEKHSKYVKSPRLEVLGGVVFGDDAVNPPDDVKGSFINSGLLHLLAASGLNVALILSMWLCIIYFINIPYKLKILSGIFIVFLYTIMTGFPPSIVRASVMLILILIGKLLYRNANGISLIFMAGLLILFFKPRFLCDVGFQLSFLVTLGLMVCVPCVNYILRPFDKNYIKKLKNFPKPIKSFLLIFSPISLVCCALIPLVAQLWAGPLQAYYFNTFSTYSVFANIAVVPFIGIVSFLGFISTAFCFIPFVSDAILPIMDFVLNFVIQIILNISNFFATLQHSIIKVPSPTPYMVATFYLMVVFFFLSVKYLFKRKRFIFAFIITFLVLLIQCVKIPDNTSEVIFFNVGNADNCLIKTPKNKYILIDTGRYIYGGLSSAKMITLEYFYDENIKKLDTLIVTHYDSDHSGGLLDILRTTKVDNLIMPKLECTSKNSCEIMKYIKENNIKYIVPHNGQTFDFEPDIKLTNYVPHVDKKESRNDTSTVTLVEFGELKFLFMADVTLRAFQSIEKFIPSNINVLKSAHHGARNTVDGKMMHKLKPEYSILSTGRNPYGHPNFETVKCLGEHSVVLSTMDLGAIKFRIKGNKIKGYHFDNSKRRFEKLDIKTK